LCAFWYFVGTLGPPGYFEAHETPPDFSHNGRWKNFDFALRTTSKIHLLSSISTTFTSNLSIKGK
jgi:hypothetical protein